MRRVAEAALLAATLACHDAAAIDDGALVVTPNAITCVAGDQVQVSAQTGARSGATFFVGGDAAWLASVQRRTATLTCEAAGADLLVVEAGTKRTTVPITVAPPPAGTLTLTMSTLSIGMTTGTTTTLDARVASALPRVSTEVRYETADSLVAQVDSVFGTVRATGPGTTTIVAAARADRSVTRSATINVIRGSTFANAIFASPPLLTVLVGDSVRVTTTVQLTSSAPPGTSRAAIYTSTDPSVATVSAAGYVRGISQGVIDVFAAAAVAPLLRARIGVFVRVPAP